MWTLGVLVQTLFRSFSESLKKKRLKLSVLLLRHHLNGEWGRAQLITDLVECRPFLFQDVQADVAVVVHVRMEAGSGELDCGRLVGVTWQRNVGSC